MPKRVEHPKEVNRRGATSGRRWKLTGLVLGLTLLLAAAWQWGALAAIPLACARAAIENHETDAARAWVRRAQHLNAERSELALMEARLERRRGALVEMDRHLDLAAKLGAQPQRIHRERVLAAAQTGQLQDIEKYLLEWLPDSGRDGAEICDAYTNGLARQGRLPEVQAFLDGWQADYPNDPLPHLKRGRIAEHDLNVGLAEREYRNALAKHPRFPPALYALGRLLLDQKRPEEALPLFRDCAQVDPQTSAAADVGAAGCLRILGRFDESRQLLGAVITVDEGQRIEAYQRVRDPLEGDAAAIEFSKLDAAEGDYAGAEKWLRRALVKNPHDLDARYALGVALQRLGQTEAAERELAHVSRVRKELAEIDALHDKLGNEPNNVAARYTIGMNYLRLQMERAGVYWLQSALAVDPEYGPAHRALAEYYVTKSAESAGYKSLADHHAAKADASSGTDSL